MQPQPISSARRLLLAIVFAAVSACSSRAQTISPIIAEYSEMGDGSFQIRNDTLSPFTVVLEARSFTVNLVGDPMYRPLDDGVTVQLSAKSFKVPPRRSYTVFYRAHSKKLPAWFTIYANIMGRPASPGVQLVIRLPHTVYLLNKGSLPRSGVKIAQGKFDPQSRKVSLLLENNSSQFDRAQSIELRSSNNKQSYGGFPLFPRQTRLVTLDWTGPFPPTDISVVFSKFKLESLFPSMSISP